VQAAAAATAGGAAAEIEHLRVDMPPGCGGGAAAEVTEKLLHLLALLKLNLVQRKVCVRMSVWGVGVGVGGGARARAKADSWGC
jgi:hypothetical protein